VKDSCKLQHTHTHTHTSGLLSLWGLFKKNSFCMIYKLRFLMGTSSWVPMSPYAFRLKSPLG